MDSALYEPVVLQIFTNLKTRLVVIPTFHDTVGDVCVTIKAYHVDLYPQWGEVDVLFVETDKQQRLSDCISIRHLFWNVPRVPRSTIFAELIPSATYTTEQPRLNIAGATGANVVSNHELHQNPAEGTLSATNGVDSNIEAPGKKRMRRKKGTSIPAEPAAVTHLPTIYEESSEQKEPHIRGESVDLLPKGADHRFGADPLLSLDEIVAVTEGLKKVLPDSEPTGGNDKLGIATADENQIDIIGKVASDPDVGRKKQRKRSHKVSQPSTTMTQQDIRGYMTRKPSQGLHLPINANDKAGNKKTRRLSPTERKLATDDVPIEKVVLGLQQDVLPASIDDETEKEVRRVTGPVKDFGTQESAEVQLKGELRQSKQRKSSVEFSKDPSRLKKSRKAKEGDSNQVPNRDHVQITFSGANLPRKSKAKKSAEGKLDHFSFNEV